MKTRPRGQGRAADVGFESGPWLSMIDEGGSGSLGGQPLPCVGLDHRGTLLGDHDRWRVGGGRARRWHDRSVDDAQRVQAMHLELAVDDAHRMAAHHAAAAGMLDGRAVLPRSPTARRRSALPVPASSRRRRISPRTVREQPAQEFETADHRAPVGVLGQIARIDHRLLARIGRSIDLPCPPLRENSTSVARVPSKTTRHTSAPVMTCRLGRFAAGFR
jgi:hypothetical protein